MADTTARSSAWSLTINNPTELDDACIRDARRLGWTVIGQKERGENGTEHYQIALRTPQMRFSAVKRVFKRAHIEPARNWGAIQAYTQKTETAIGDLPEGTIDPKLVQTPEDFWKVLREYCDAEAEYSNWGVGQFNTHPTQLDLIRAVIRSKGGNKEFVKVAVRELLLDGYQRIAHWATQQPIRLQIQDYLPELLASVK